MALIGEAGTGCRNRLFPPISRVLAALLIIVTALPGCVSTPLSTGLLEQPPGDLNPAVELTWVPFFPQQAFQCGPAALATVLSNRQIEVSPDELVNKVYVPDRRGSFQVEMVAAARSYGRLVYPLAPSLEQLLREVAAGHPALVLQNLGLGWYPVWHFAVVVGYDLAAGEILLRSGTEARQRLPLVTFERTWAGGDHWAVLVLPADRLPVTAQPLAYVKAAENLVETGRLEAARSAYEAASRHWPEHALVQFGLGNLAYAQADYAAARRAFAAQLRLAPTNASGWNNFAYALAQSGCATATRAAQCALALGENAPQLDSTPEEVARLLRRRPPLRAESGVCELPACPVQIE